MDNGFTEVIPSEYKQKKWGKTMEGEYIIDGYNFKGKQSFKKAKVGLYDLMKRGIKGEVEGVEYRVLDRRTKGAEEEIEIEIVDNGSRGVAVLKLYGPNKQKEYIIMVTKSKWQKLGLNTIFDFVGKIFLNYQIVYILIFKFNDKLYHL